MRTRPGVSRWAMLLPFLALGALSCGCATTSPPLARAVDGNTHTMSAKKSPDPSPAVFPTAFTAPAKTVAARPAPPKTTSAVPHVLGRGQEVLWLIQNAPAAPGIVKSGRSMIGPDGTMVVGPYGTCKVEGLTEPQAARKLEAMLRSHVKNPQVQLVAARAESAVHQSAWRKSATGFGELVRASGQDTPLEPGGKLLVPDLKFEVPPPKETKDVAPAPPHAPAHASRHDAAWAAPGQGMYVKGLHAKGFPVYPDVPSELNPTLLPPYVIGPPDVLLIQSRHALVTHPIQGQHLVRPDGTVGLSVYGSPIVAGLTIEQAKESIARTISPKLKLPKDIDEKTGKIESYYEPEEQLKVVREGLVVDVLAYNSKVYYVITDGGGFGEQVVRIPVTGGETVLDAISQVNGLSPVSSKHHVWVARRTPGHGAPDSILKVDWIGITQRGATATNYQIMPGDRVYVKADHWRTADTTIAKVLAPFERILGITLLGSQTVNSIRNRNTGNN